MSREEQAAREMMLPRSNKNTLKVNINRDDDDQEIEAKKEIARKNMKKNTGKSDYSAEMDIEGPTQRRRTDIIPSQQ